MDRPFEPVHTVTDYYDGPRLGVADFHGAPHVYRSLWRDAEDPGDAERFELAPLSPEAFAAVLEDWTIWRRFERAYRAGEAQWSGNEAEWGALPEDRARRDLLRPAVAAALTIKDTHRFVARGEFRARGPVPVDHRPGSILPLEVRWVPAE